MYSTVAYLGYWDDDPGFESRYKQQIFLFSKMSRLAWNPPALLFNG
jgi:hypothetical protein